MFFGSLNGIKPPPPAKILSITLPGLTTDSATNYGGNWTNSTISTVTAPNYSFLGSGISGLGQYQVVPTYNLNGIFVSNDYGSTWSLKSSVVDLYFTVYISYSGKYVFIPTFTGKMYKSTDFGANFSVAFDPKPNYYFFSQNETYHGYISSTNRLNISSNSGTSFSIPSALSSVSIISAAFSQDGKYQLAISSTNIYVSNNLGVTYTSKLGGLSGLSSTLTPSFGVGVAMSLNGQYMFVNSSTILRYSNDYGLTWIDSSGVTGSNTLECSYTGKYVSLRTTTNVYISSDFGATFTSKYNSTNISGKRMSLDGKYLIVVNTGNTNMQISKNYGESWTTVTTGINAAGTGNNFLSPNLSADGKYMLLATNINLTNATNYVYRSAN
jgi:hypothetical protein